MSLQPNSIFIKRDARALYDCMQRYSTFCNINTARAVQLAQDGIKFFHGTLPDEQHTQTLQYELEARWYASLDAGAPDYGIYAHDYYVCDLWACWALYSRKYLHALQTARIFDKGQTFVERYTDSLHGIVDVGCGLGYSTAALKELFCHAEVFGTNLDNTPQYRFAQDISAERNVRIVASRDAILLPIDLLFASEYFEHFQDPIAHLDTLLLGQKPRVLVIINSFGTVGMGHFISYIHGGKSIPGKQMARYFHDALRAHGYRQPLGRYWNNRPAVWELRHE